MADAIKLPSRPQYCHDVSWNPLSYRWPSAIFNQHYGLPPLLDPQDLSWMEGIFRRLGTSSWPGYLRTAPVFAQAPGQQHMSKIQREMSGGVSEVFGEMCKWKISLDVNHFAPSEITLSQTSRRRWSWKSPVVSVCRWDPYSGNTITQHSPPCWCQYPHPGID